ncbi:MAG: hypothetical protein P1U63_11935 [Coxiellaceae bacterium]|nr:hypothetical protein [Coxiellaceae bacterium]
MRRSPHSDKLYASLPSMNKTLSHSLLRYLRTDYTLSDETLETLGFSSALHAHLESTKPTKNSLKALADVWCKANEAALAEYKIEHPVRTIYHENKRIRRMDSLAKLLAPNEEASPCIAVAITTDGIVISSNRTRKSAEYNRKSIHTIVHKKLRILRELFAAYESTTDNGIKERLLQNAADDLITTGGTCSLNVADKTKRRHQHYKQKDNLVSILRKVTLSALSPASDESGFSNSNKRMLTAANPCIFIYPNEAYERKLDGSLHAEQLLVNHIEARGRHDKFSEPLPIGITKLACTDCDHVLKSKPYIAYRGSHGMTFPGVVDTITKELSQAAEIARTVSLKGESLADDSDSSDDDDDDLSTSLSSASSTPPHSTRTTTDQELHDYKSELYRRAPEENMFSLLFRSPSAASSVYDTGTPTADGEDSPALLAAAAPAVDTDTPAPIAAAAAAKP